MNSVAPTEYTSLCASTIFARPRACSGDMNAGVPIGEPVCVMLTARSVPDQAGDSEIEDLEQATPREKQIVRLDVAVDDAARVRVRERVEHLSHRVERLARGQLPAARAREFLEGLPSSSSITR